MTTPGYWIAWFLAFTALIEWVNRQMPHEEAPLRIAAAGVLALAWPVILAGLLLRWAIYLVAEWASRRPPPGQQM